MIMINESSMMIWWGVLLCLCAVSAQDVSSKVVTIAQGPVRGYKEPNADVYAFRSIPYATAPTGVNRFKAPLPPPTWTETFEAINRGIICPQMLPPTINLPRQEDCLIANLYVPDTNATDLPVMVIVHGGAFQMGFGEVERVVALVNTKKMIAVNFNYRLGVHGFLCLGNDEAPGNAGAKDQVALLRWVKTNIAAFGGNPSDVTISGCSAGGASVDLLRLSKTTEGLFNKVIASSGGNAGSFGIQHDPLANAKFYADALDFDKVEDLSELTNFYTSSSLDLLFSRADLASNRHDSTVLWAPCVERGVADVERFLEDAPVNILKNGEHKHVPILYGFANMEGLMRLSVFNSWRGLMNESFSAFLPGDLEFENDEEREAIAARVREFYFKDEEITERDILAFIDYFTDTLFGYSMLRSVKLNAENGNSQFYLYEYSFTDENTPIIPHTNVSGADHCDQYMAVLDGDEINITPEYRHMRAVMRRLFLDFITTGNPVSENSTLDAWGPADGNRSPHMDLNFNSTLLGPLLQARAELWDSVYEAHYRAPIPPPEPASAASIRACFLLIVYSLVVLISNF